MRTFCKSAYKVNYFSQIIKVSDCFLFRMGRWNVGQTCFTYTYCHVFLHQAPFSAHQKAYDKFKQTLFRGWITYKVSHLSGFRRGYTSFYLIFQLAHSHSTKHRSYVSTLHRVPRRNRVIRRKN